MIEYIIILLLGAYTIASFLFIVRLIKKVEFYEDWIVAFRNRVNYANDKIKEIDIRGSFESDDEIGFIYKTIRQLSEDLDKFVE